MTLSTPSTGLAGREKTTGEATRRSLHTRTLMNNLTTTLVLLLHDQMEKKNLSLNPP